MDDAVPRCNLCGSASRRPRFTGSDRMSPVAGRFTLFECRVCGLAFLWPLPPASLLPALYPDMYYSYHQRGTGAQPRISATGAFVERLRQILFPRGFRLTPGDRILDVGCGDGQFLLPFLAAGLECHGIDINAGAIARAAGAGVYALRGSLEEAGYPDGFFAVVTAWQVLEHLPAPGAFLAEIRRILRPGGTLVLSVPNDASVARRVFGRHWVGYDVPRHCFAFSPATLRQYLVGAGFRIRSVRYVGGPYSLLASVGLALHPWLAPEPLARRLASLTASATLRLLAFPVALALNGLRMGDVIKVWATAATDAMETK